MTRARAMTPLTARSTSVSSVGAAANVHAADRARLDQNDRAAGGPAAVGKLADPRPRHVRQRPSEGTLFGGEGPGSCRGEPRGPGREREAEAPAVDP